MILAVRKGIFFGSCIFIHYTGVVLLICRCLASSIALHGTSSVGVGMIPAGNNNNKLTSPSSSSLSTGTTTALQESPFLAHATSRAISDGPHNSLLFPTYFASCLPLQQLALGISYTQLGQNNNSPALKSIPSSKMFSVATNNIGAKEVGGGGVIKRVEPYSTPRTMSPVSPPSRCSVSNNQEETLTWNPPTVFRSSQMNQISQAVPGISVNTTALALASIANLGK